MRDQLVIATKGRFPMGDGPNDAGLTRTHLTRALDASLRRLGVDAVDLYQAHAWDPLTPIEETLGFFDDAVRAGKIRYAGVSNFVGWQLQKAALLAGATPAPIVTLQPQYNLLVRDIELEIVDVCRNEGIGILPWSPLAGGWLTGKYTPRRARRPARPGSARTPTAAWRRTARATPQERTWRIIDAVRQVADGRGRVDGAGRAGLGRRPPGRHLGDPRRPHRRPARRQPRRRRPAPVGRGDRAARPRPAPRWSPTTPTARPASTSAPAPSPTAAPPPGYVGAVPGRRAGAQGRAGSR